MRHSRTRLLIDGVVAGLIGGAVIALWFFIFDAARGEPLKTPMILSSALLHGAVQPTLGSAAWTLVAEYTVAHFIAFAIIGAVAAMLMAAAEEHSELFGTLFLFTIGFEVFFIALVMLMGPAAQAAVSWWKGMIGNLMATAAMLAYFFWRQPVLASNLLGPWQGVVREGITTGLIGAVIVAVWFLVADLIAGHPFRTPALLGAIIFNGMAAPSSVSVTAALVLGYTALHFFAFIMFGIAASITMYASEREPLLALGVLVLFLWFELCFAGFVTYLDQSTVQQLGWWNIAGGNILALAVIIGWYEHRHPRVLPRILERWEELKSEGSAAGPGASPRPAPRHV
ncbi:MAG: hypothetical protein HY269_05945 [Deltaproteobacteria bacterium]|nr:hypothetical protein [Deltaproteobacteria bacterium]